MDARATAQNNFVKMSDQGSGLRPQLSSHPMMQAGRCIQSGPQAFGIPVVGNAYALRRFVPFDGQWRAKPRRRIHAHEAALDILVNAIGCLAYRRVCDQFAVTFQPVVLAMLPTARFVPATASMSCAHLCSNAEQLVASTSRASHLRWQRYNGFADSVHTGGARVPVSPSPGRWRYGRSQRLEIVDGLRVR